MFPLDYPHEALAGAEPASWVLDPFCGRGTTNYAARLRGLPTVGIDTNPVAVAIAQAKLVSVTPDEIIAEARTLLTGVSSPRHVPDGEFWSLCYHRDTLREVCRIREALLGEAPPPGSPDVVWLNQCDRSTAARIALRGLMLGILHGPLTKRLPSYLSNQMPRTYATKPVPAVRFWRRRGHEPPKVDTLALIERRARYTFAQLPDVVPSAIRLADSRRPEALVGVVPDAGFRWVVTSPPYFGMRFYRSDQWLRNWFLGGPDDVDYDVIAQLGAERLESYAQGLAQVWHEVAHRCASGAYLICRFGSLPSMAYDALETVRCTLSGAGWKIESIRSAGQPPRGRRQADQFVRPRAQVQEWDVTAIRV